MGTITVSLPSDGTTADVADYNTPINTIVNEFNGNIDNANIKTAAGIAGSKLSNSSVTADKLSTGAATNHVATSESTTSTSFTDLATAGPAVTVTIGANGLAFVTIYCAMTNNTATGYAQMSFALSGANTLAAAAENALQVNNPVDNRFSASFLLTGLTAGSTTFTAKYVRLTAGTATFSNRKISVIPL